MQEEVENRTVNLAISTTKLTFRTIVNGYNAWKRHHQAKVAQKTAQLPVGKQSIKELIGQNQGVSSIPIEKTDLKGFEQVARKYGVDYAITKDQNVMPPKYTVFFKAKDADALTSAFEEFTNRKLKTKEKPSVLEQLNKLKELVAAILPDKVRHKSQERDLWTFFKWVFKTFLAVTLISNTFNITMAVFDVAQQVISRSGGLISGSTSVSDATLTAMQATLEGMDLGPLLGLYLQTFVVQVTMLALSAIIFVIVYGKN